MEYTLYARRTQDDQAAALASFGEPTLAVAALLWASERRISWKDGQGWHGHIEGLWHELRQAINDTEEAVVATCRDSKLTADQQFMSAAGFTVETPAQRDQPGTSGEPAHRQGSPDPALRPTHTA